MTELKCPFCGQKLHKDSDGYYTCYTDNCGCWANGGNGASGSESLWLTLIRTHKALDVAIEYMKHTQKVSPFWFNRLANKTLDKIKTALDQKDVK